MRNSILKSLVISSLFFLLGCEDDTPLEKLIPINFELIWQKSIGEFNKSEIVFSFIKTNDGGYMSSGNIWLNNSDTDISIIKYNSSLEIIWEKIFKANNHDRGTNLIETSDGNFIVSGWTNSTEGDIKSFNGSYDVFLLKFDGIGNTIWQKSYGGSQSEMTSNNSLIETKNGNLMVVGSSKSNNSDVKENFGGSDLWLINLKNNGEIIWERSYGGSKDDYGRQIIEYNGNYIVGFGSRSNNGDFLSSGNFITLFDANGEIKWFTNLGGLNYGKTIIDKNGGFITLMATKDTGSKLEIVKTNESGKSLWRSVFGGSKQEFPEDLIQLNDLSLIVLGLSKSNDGDIGTNYGGDDVIVSKLNNRGKILGIKNFGGSKREWANIILETGKGEYLINASTTSNNIDVEQNYGDTGIDNWLFKIKEFPK